MGKLLFELVRRSAADGSAEWHLLGDRRDWPMHAPGHERVQATVVETRGFRFHAWEQWTLPRLARHVDADVLHAPATTMPWWQPVPSVVTINDVIPWEKPDAGSFYRGRLLPAAYHRASAVLTISQTSCRDIVARWPALKTKLHVVSPGVDQRYLDTTPEACDIVIGDRPVQPPYLVYLGGSDPRKRLDWALEVWREVASTRPVSLVVCGLRKDEHAAIVARVPPLLHDRLYLAPFVSEAEMPRLYMRAAAVLYPTLYEGFGLPVVEAHAVGTPVLFSDVGSLSELKGPGAVVLPVSDRREWMAATNKALDTVRTSDFISKARNWAMQFSWDAYVNRTLKVYESVALHASGQGSAKSESR
jgi:glycosyltransferase involved in cell wall biosynthesis